MVFIVTLFLALTKHIFNADGFRAESYIEAGFYQENTFFFGLKAA